MNLNAKYEINPSTVTESNMLDILKRITCFYAIDSAIPSFYKITRFLLIYFP